MARNLKHDLKVSKEEYENEIKKYHQTSELPREVDRATFEAQEFYKGLTESEKIQLNQQLVFRKAKNNYIDYLRYVFPNYTFTNFHIFLAKVCQTVVERIEQGKKVRILLSVPPRHGKSETITKTLPSWFVGRNPDKNAILTAYNADLAEKFEDANRQKTREFGKDIFGIEISESQDNKTLYQIKGHVGGVMGVGIQGGITGNGGELIIIDDPYKNSTEANSSSTRSLIENIYRDSIYTRLQGKGNGLIVIQTRWHEEDLCGILEKDGKENGWICINIPCICEDEKHDVLKRRKGETLCPELGFDAEWANATKNSVGLKVWDALYQGHPSIEGGEIFTREMIKQYKPSELPSSFEEEVISCDLTFGGKAQSNDPVAIQVWGRVGANHYLLKRINKRMNFNEMCNTIKMVSYAYPNARKKIVEKKANGQAVIDTLNSVIGGFVPYDPKMESKISRANSVAPMLLSGNVFLPCKEIDNKIENMIEEMMKFPNSTHDDDVDAMTQYLINSTNNSYGKICGGSEYTTLNDIWRGIKI